MKLFNLKKLFLVSSLTLSTLFSVSEASTLSISIPAGTAINLMPNFSSTKITQIIATAAGTNYTTNLLVYDCPTNVFAYTNAAYTNIISYATNYISTWTNYYGATNSVTNISLVDATNNVAAQSNSYPQRMNLAFPSNSVTRLDNVNYYFYITPWVTNVGPGAISLTVTFQQ